MRFVCVKWGDKFTHEHVNRLYKMVCKNYKDDFTFVCYTENSNDIDPNIIIGPLELEYDLENWWWKLLLFKTPIDDISIFLDLDIVIQKDITHYKDYCEKDKVCVVKCYWKPWLENIEPLIKDQFDMNINSSIMIWKGDMSSIWNTFIDDPEYYLFKYKGIDSYLNFDHPDKLAWLPKGEIYSRLYGIDDVNHWNPAKDPSDRTLREGFYFSDTHSICIFNGWKKKRNFFDGEYALDDDGYDGYEIYWN